MATQEMIFAGFGGQGILSMAKFIAYAGMDNNMNVSWLPSYGPEMRGGTANASVILTDDQVGSPIVLNPDSLIVMNRPSLDKFEDVIKANGLLVMDSDLVTREPKRTDITVVKVPAQTEAAKLGSTKIANMVLLGALVAQTNIVSMDMILKALKDHGKEKFYEVNKKALEVGASYVK